MKKVSSKGLYIGDIHFQENIINRKDNFLDTASLKLQEALELARDTELQYVVLLGDLFHVCEPSAIVRNKVTEIFAKGNNGKTWPFDIFLVVGNHDMYYKSLKVLEKTAVKTLETVGLIKICESSEKYGIYFSHFENGIENKKIDVNLPIIAAHSYILPKESIIDSILIDDFYTNDVNRLVISGHYHDGYDIIEKKKGLFFANPGSLGRIASSDIKRDNIYVAMVELNKGEIDNIEYIPLKLPQLGNIIFNTSIINEKKKKEVDISGFIKSINEAKVVVDKSIDILEAIRDFGKQTKVDQNIINEAMNRISMVNKNGDD